MTPKRHRRSRFDDRAESGIGVMIVFIASTLVAAVAAGVLIDAGGSFSKKSTDTGRDVSKSVSTNVQTILWTGYRASTAVDMQGLNLTIGLAPGSLSTTLAEMKLQISNATSTKTLSYLNGAPSGTTFNASEIRDTDNSFTAASPSMNAGDVITINVNLESVLGAALATRQDLNLLLLPEQGQPVDASFQSPTSYASNTVIPIR